MPKDNSQLYIAFSIAALVAGILAIPAGYTVVGGVLLGAVAIVLGVISLRRGRKGLSIAGIACGSVGILASFVLLIAGISIFGRFHVVRVGHAAPDTGPTIISVHEAVADKLAFYSAQIANDDYCAFTITEIELDRSGNLVVHYEMRNHSKANYLWFMAVVDTWTVNDQAVNPEFSEVLYYEESNAGWFYIPAEQLSHLSDIRQVYSVRGTVHCYVMDDGDISSEFDYEVAL